MKIKSNSKIVFTKFLNKIKINSHNLWLVLKIKPNSTISRFQLTRRYQERKIPVIDAATEEKKDIFDRIENRSIWREDPLSDSEPYKLFSEKLLGISNKFLAKQCFKSLKMSPRLNEIKDFFDSKWKLLYVWFIY